MVLMVALGFPSPVKSIWILSYFSIDSRVKTRFKNWLKAPSRVWPTTSSAKKIVTRAIRILIFSKTVWNWVNNDSKWLLDIYVKCKLKNSSVNPSSLEPVLYRLEFNGHGTFEDERTRTRTVFSLVAKFSICMLADLFLEPSDLFWLAQPKWLILLLQSSEPSFWVHSFTFRYLQSLYFGNFIVFQIQYGFVQNWPENKMRRYTFTWISGKIRTKLILARTWKPNRMRCYRIRISNRIHPKIFRLVKLMTMK